MLDPQIGKLRCSLKGLELEGGRTELLGRFPQSDKAYFASQAAELLTHLPVVWPPPWPRRSPIRTWPALSTSAS
jgi:hypothetical protein